MVRKHAANKKNTDEAQVEGEQRKVEKVIAKSTAPEKVTKRAKKGNKP